MKIVKSLIIFLIVLMTMNVVSSWAELTINLIAVNASADQTQEIEVKYYLPKELEPEDVVDAGILKVEYDVDKGGYYVYGKVTFQPKESKTFKIKVADVWMIEEKEIDILKKQLDNNLKLIPKDADFETAQKARDTLTAQLDFIFAQQKGYSENIERRIEEFRAYKTMLDDIRDKVYSLDFLVHDAKALGEINEQKTVKFVIEVRNPSEDKEKKVTQKHYLPEEVREEHIIEKQGFDVRFDESKNRSYLAKEEEVFQPAETKKYQIVLKDIWQFPIGQVDAIMERATLAMEELKESIYAESSVFLFDSIKQRVEEIKVSQAQERPIKEHIGIFRVNQHRYKLAKEDLERMEQMMAIVRMKKLEELEGSQVKNVLSKLKALRGLQALSEALFQKGISVTMTWKIIFGTLIFVAFFTTLHFFLWSKRSKRMGEEHSAGDGTVTEVPKPGTAPAKEA